MLVTIALVYLAIGAVIWALLIAPQGFGGASVISSVVATIGSILIWPVIMFVIAVELTVGMRVLRGGQDRTRRRRAF